ncbi:MAG: hypothetical protein JEZ00_14135 [Anaerolineaceae bacterium]|nr:hypothetical protein [Anaerolineaceae bacterium]
MKQLSPFLGFSGRVIVAHFLTYFCMGLVFYLTGLNVLVYYEQHAEPLVTAFFRPTSSLLVMAGPFFQLLRGGIFALVLYPFRSVFLEKKWGWLYLWGIFLGLAVFAPSSAAPGSIEGFVYTNFPISFHLIYLPEIVIQTLAFAGLVVFWEHYNVKKLTIPLVVVFVLILLVNAPVLF